MSGPRYYLHRFPDADNWQVVDSATDSFVTAELPQAEAAARVRDLNAAEARR